MNCNFVIKKLYDYLNDEIDDKNKQIIEKHLHTCQSCNKTLNTLQSLKFRFKKDMQNPSPAVLYKIKKETKTSSWTDFIFLHKKIFGFSASFAFIIIGMILFYSFFNKQDYFINKFLYEMYNFNTIEENIFETVSTLDIFNND